MEIDRNLIMFDWALVFPSALLGIILGVQLSISAFLLQCPEAY